MKEWDPRRIKTLAHHMVERQSFRVSGELRVFLITLVWDWLYRDEKKDPLFTIDEWRDNDAGIVRQIASANELQVGIAAYEKAVQNFPRCRITLRHGIRIVRSTEKDRQRAEFD